MNLFALGVFGTVVFALAVACDRGTEELLRNADGGSDASDVLDAPATLRWSAPEPIASLSSIADERFPVPTRGGLAIVFARSEDRGSARVNVPHRASRQNRADDFGPAVRLSNFEGSVRDLESTGDELEWFYWTGGASLKTASRASVSEPLSPPSELGLVGFSPSVSASGGALYFLGLDGGVFKVGRASSSEPWSLPIRVTVDASFPIASMDVSRDELALVIAAESDSIFAGIYISRRTSLADPFGRPERISILEGPFSNPRWSQTNDEIYFSGPASNGDDLFRSRLHAHSSVSELY